MGAPTKEESKNWFLKQLKANGGSLGNGAFLKTLEWNEKRYWSIHSELLSEGKITLGRGRGGTVILIDKLATSREENAPGVAKTAKLSKLERTLYEPVMHVLQNSWIQARYDQWVVEITANQRLKGNGVWTQPDIAAVGTASYSHLPGRIFEIVTFEVKKYDAVDVRGVFEAISHQQLANMSYVIFCTDGKKFDAQSKEWTSIKNHALGFGVGVIVAEDAAVWRNGNKLSMLRVRYTTPREQMHS